jgi:hypothetical protein
MEDTTKKFEVSVTHIIHHQYPLIVLQSLRGNFQKMSHNIWWYMINHKNHSDYNGMPIVNITLNHTYSVGDRWKHLGWREGNFEVFEVANQLNK